ncbi:hypothetical protein LTR28_002426 [Elasticomyces elasticus]|nr:hypothetical protein LTR28_002426 [Elasticomyces elasticus]
MYALGSFLILLPVTLAAHLTISIPASPPVLPNPASLPASTHATLLGPPGVYLDTPLTRRNTFEFSNLTVGSHLLQVYARDYAFSPYRVDVSLAATEDGDTERRGTARIEQELIQVWQTFRGNEWSNLGPKIVEGTDSVTVEIGPVGRKEFYIQRGGFNVLGMLKSPMILLGLFSVVLIFGMPYLMENMDPETKAEFEEMQKKSPLTGSQGAAAQIQNFDLASWMAGKSAETESSSGTQ